MPDATVTDEQYDLVREMAGENSLAFITTRVNLLTNAQWGRMTSVFMPRREEGAGDYSRLKTRSGLDDDPERQREGVRRDVRLMLGLLALDSTESESCLPGSVFVPLRSVW